MIKGTKLRALSKILLGLGALVGLCEIAALSAQGLQNVGQNIGEHDTLIQRAMTACQTTYALLGPLTVWLVWRRHYLAARFAWVWALALVLAVVLIIPAWAPDEAESWWQFLGGGAAFALVGGGGMWCLAQLRRTD
jgi:hypothetical protein